MGLCLSRKTRWRDRMGEMELIVYLDRTEHGNGGEGRTGGSEKRRGETRRRGRIWTNRTVAITRPRRRGTTAKSAPSSSVSSDRRRRRSSLKAVQAWTARRASGAGADDSKGKSSGRSGATSVRRSIGAVRLRGKPVCLLPRTARTSLARRGRRPVTTGVGRQGGGRATERAGEATGKRSGERERGR